MKLWLYPNSRIHSDSKNRRSFLALLFSAGDCAALAVQGDTMNWLEMSEDEILNIANPIMDNLMQASTDIDHERHVRDFSERLKKIVTKENLEQQCNLYQKELGCFSDRELMGVVRKDTDVRIFWKQWYTKSKNEYLAFIHLIENNGKIEVVNASVS